MRLNDNKSRFTDYEEVAGIHRFGNLREYQEGMRCKLMMAKSMLRFSGCLTLMEILEIYWNYFFLLEILEFY